MPEQPSARVRVRAPQELPATPAVDLTVHTGHEPVSEIQGGALQQDIWGHCDACQRWFPCQGWFDRTAPQPVCPACACEPRAIVNRSAVGLGEIA